MVAPPLRRIRIFYSFPDNMNSYVAAAKTIVERCNSRWERNHTISVRSITYKDLPSGYEKSGVHEYLLRNLFDEFEIYCGFMGPHFGTPSGTFGSGTEEEYSFALRLHEAGGAVRHVMFGFCEAPINPFAIDPAQLTKAQEFRRVIGEKQLYFVWNSKTDFSTKFEQQMDELTYKFANDPNYFVRGGVRYK